MKNDPRTGTPERALLLALCALAIAACGRVNTTVNPGSSSLTVVTSALPAGKVGVVYSATLQAGGGTPPYMWSVGSGSLRHGLLLDAATGVISGTPDTDGDSDDAVTFAVGDSGNPAQTASATLALEIAAADLDILTTALPAGTVGTPYSATLSASGGTPPYLWTLTAGTLPAGLALNGASGVLAGTPAASGSTPLSLQLTDSSKPARIQSVALVLNISSGVVPGGLQITTTALPAGAVGTPYNALLSASGGTPPYTWTLTGGALPAGLSLAPSGAIAGTPTAAANATPLTFQVTDSSSPTLAKSVTLPLTVSSAITIAIAPRTAALTVTQSIQVSATTTDPAGVSWNLTPAGGTIAPAKSLSLAKVTLTAPGSAGVYMLTATSVSNPAVSASIAVAVTGLAGVYTYHDDLARDGANTQEYALTPANVNTTQFGRLFSCRADGAVYAQPLWVANLTIAGAKHNVVFVATQHDSVYAFDADDSSCQEVWPHVSLIDGAHGGTAGETTAPWTLIGGAIPTGDIQPEVGVTGTPVIDPVAGVLYVVSKSVLVTGTPPTSTFYQRLHAIDLASGSEKPGSPVTIAATYPGTGDGGTTTAFSARHENQRAGLALVNGTVYIAWASHEDATPWYGWVIAYTYNGSAFSAPVALNVCPNTRECGIWMSGGAPSADAAGHLYVITGNGGFDVTNAAAPNNDYGDSFLQLASSAGAISVSSWFTPTDQLTDNLQDRDFGAGGSAVVLNLGAGSPQHLVIGGGKDGTLYLLNGDAMGGLGDGHARQFFALGHAIFATGAFWNNTFYIAGLNGPMNAFAFDPGTGMFNATATSQSHATFGFPGSTPSVSALGSTNGIVWSLDNGQYCTHESRGCGPAVLHAHNAANLAMELWNSSLVAADAAGNAVKFTVPTVANGKIYVGNRGNNTGGPDSSSSTPGQIDVYGLKP
jgi:hypothetical protein